MDCQASTGCHRAPRAADVENATPLPAKGYRLTDTIRPSTVDEHYREITILAAQWHFGAPAGDSGPAATVARTTVVAGSTRSVIKSSAIEGRRGAEDRGIRRCGTATRRRRESPAEVAGQAAHRRSDRGGAGHRRRHPQPLRTEEPARHRAGAAPETKRRPAQRGERARPGRGHDGRAHRTAGVGVLRHPGGEFLAGRPGSRLVRVGPGPVAPGPDAGGGAGKGRGRAAGYPAAGARPGRSPRGLHGGGDRVLRRAVTRTHSVPQRQRRLGSDVRKRSGGPGAVRQSGAAPCGAAPVRRLRHPVGRTESGVSLLDPAQRDPGHPARPERPAPRGGHRPVRGEDRPRRPDRRPARARLPGRLTATLDRAGQPVRAGSRPADPLPR